MTRFHPARRRRVVPAVYEVGHSGGDTLNPGNIKKWLKFAQALCRSRKIVADGPASKLLVRHPMSGETSLERKLCAEQCGLDRPAKIAGAGRCRGSRFQLYV